MLKHSRVSTVSDDLSQPDLIQPSDWNDDHVVDDPAALRAALELGALAAKDTVATTDLNDHAVSYVKIQNISATDKLLGRASSGAGVIEEIALTSFGRALIDDTSVANQRTTLGLGTAAVLDSDTDPDLAANSDAKVATQKAVKTYIDDIVTGGAAGVMIFKGIIDCSANPNYPAADAGHVYKVSVAGKIGGASGVNVEAGDTLYCITNSSASGTQAGVGANWNIAQVNIDGAALTSGTLAQFAATSSAQLAGVLNDETGSASGGVAVFNNAPALTNPTVTTQASGDNSTKAASTAFVQDAIAKQPEVYPVAIADETTAITVGDAKVTFRIPFACTMTQLPRASVNTVSSSGNPAFDINKNGASIFSVTLTIDASEKTSVTATTACALSGGSTTFADDDEVTIDIDTAGTGTKGAKITLYLVRT